MPGESSGCGGYARAVLRDARDRQYVVYWDVFTPAEFQAKEAEYAAELSRRKELDGRTVDRVNPGEEQNERDHSLEGERTSAGTSATEVAARRRRRILPLLGQGLASSAPGALRHVLGLGQGQTHFRRACGRDESGHGEAREQPSRAVLRPDLQAARGTHQGKSHVTVTFQARPRHMAGGIFGLRVLSPKP